MTEPPAVEGYIKRVRVKTQAKILTYLTTQSVLFKKKKKTPPSFRQIRS